MFAQIYACYPARLTAKSGKLCLIMPVQSHPYMFIKYSYKAHIRAHRSIQASNTRAIYHYVSSRHASGLTPAPFLGIPVIQAFRTRGN